MNRRRTVAVPVDAAEVPAGLRALRVERATVDGDGRVQVAAPGPGGPRRLSLVAEDTTGVLDGELDHGTVRAALVEPGRRRSTRDPLAADDVAIALARLGLVRLQVPATTEGGTVTVGQWWAWERTKAGTAWAERYAAFDGDDPVVTHAVRQADRLTDGDAERWVAAVLGERERLAALCQRATDLVDDGRAHGWSVERFAEEVTGDPAGLDDGAPFADLVLASVARHLGVGAADGADRDGLLRAIGIGASVLSGVVASIRLPGGGGAAGALLTAGAAHDVPVLLPQSLVVDAGGRPIAPPRSLGTVFAVQHEASFIAAAAEHVRTPVVLHGGSPAAVHLLRTAMAAGWQVVVCADDDEAGRHRRDWLVARLGDGAVAWRAGEGVGEADRLDLLLSDVRSGRVA